MKAIICTRYGPPDVLQLKEVATPTPKKTEVLVKILATAVTASDCIVRGFNVAGAYRLPMGLVVGFRAPRQPILGMAFAGEVKSSGEEVKRFKEGDQVYGLTMFRFGTYAEFTCVPENSLAALKPSNMSYQEAAAVPYGGLLALHFLKKGNIRNEQKVLIYGASGAIGTAAVQLARFYGAEVTAVCGSTNIALVESLGANKVIDYTKEDFTNSGAQYDLILNAVGKRKAQLQCEKVLAPNGKHITVDDGSPKFQVNQLNLLRELAEAGKLRPVIDRCYPLAQMVEAHRYVDKGHKKGNVVIAM